MKFNKSKKFFAGLMASLFVSGIGFNAKAIRTPEEINETIKLMFEGQDAETLRKRNLSNVTYEFKSNQFLDALQEHFIKANKRSVLGVVGVRLKIGLMLALYSQSLRGTLQEHENKTKLHQTLCTYKSVLGAEANEVYRSAAITLSEILTKTPEEVKTYINTLSEGNSEKLKHLYLGCLFKI